MELRRIREAKEAAAAREKFEETKAQIAIAKAKREKAAEKAHAAKVRKMIEQDKAERKAAAEARRRRAAGESRADASTNVATTSTDNAATPKKEYDEALIVVRLPGGGGSIQSSFPVDATVAQVTEWARKESQADVKLMTTFPRKIYSADDQTKLSDINGMVRFCERFLISSLNNNQGSSRNVSRNALTQQMSWFYGFVLFVSVSIVVVYLLNKYASWRERHWLVLLGTGTGWFLAFAVAILLPIDISSVC